MGRKESGTANSGNLRESTLTTGCEKRAREKRGTGKEKGGAQAIKGHKEKNLDGVV